MSVKRYDIEAYLYYDDCRWETAESVDGDFVYASDYDELRERVAWLLECEDYLFFLDLTNRWRSMFAYPELRHIVNAARKAVEELL